MDRSKLRCCPRCQLPAKTFGRALLATAIDWQRVGVVLICTRCTASIAGLPERLVPAPYRAAVTRAMDDPARYTVRLLPDFGAAQLAVGLLEHPDYSERALEAILAGMN